MIDSLLESIRFFPLTEEEEKFEFPKKDQKKEEKKTKKKSKIRLISLPLSGNERLSEAREEGSKLLPIKKKERSTAEKSVGNAGEQNMKTCTEMDKEIKDEHVFDNDNNHNIITDMDKDRHGQQTRKQTRD
ncbi:hypothetical protein CHS0354_011779 [Potamilus streckersoni]|uniref:Uncharacterized protein n=1 Tax=Potamilus streckersoni TaxID=2493646 RepID=A0AAE0THA1_9BIVA|nr:hypothetical protein CHS0354_011779 [Potamilus streckersoni]